MLCLKLGGYSNVYLCSDNHYVVGTVENLPIVGNHFFTGVISDANGTKTSPVSLILYSDGVVVLFTYGINLDDNTYNVLNVSVML